MKAFAILMAAMLLTASPALAQKKNKSFKEKATVAVDKSKKMSKDAADAAGNALNDAFNGLGGKEDLVKVKGQYYMPIYDTNLYGGSDAQTYADECLRQFYARYPQAKVKTAAFPQTDWLIEPVMKDDVLQGYMRTLFCYIIARDVDGNMINARFSYKCYKAEGDNVYKRLTGNWPRWERTDHLTPEIYNRL